MVLGFMLVLVARIGYGNQVVAFCMLESCCRCFNLAVGYAKLWRKYRLSCISYERGFVGKKIIINTFEMEAGKTLYFSLGNVVVRTYCGKKRYGGRGEEENQDN